MAVGREKRVWRYCMETKMTLEGMEAVLDAGMGRKAAVQGKG